MWWAGKEPPAFYSYQTDGEFAGKGVCDPSPLEPGVWLVPGSATLEPPPELGANETAVWVGNRWKVIPDHRGEVRYGDGQFFVVDSLGVPPLPPIAVHDAQWIIHPEGTKLRMWINEDEIDFFDDPNILPRKVLAAWEAKGETIRPADEPEIEPEEPAPERAAPEKLDAEREAALDARIREVVEGIKSEERAA